MPVLNIPGFLEIERGDAFIDYKIATVAHWRKPKAVAKDGGLPDDQRRAINRYSGTREAVPHHG